MLPWGHAAIGYLCYTLYQRVQLGLRPRGGAVLALGFATQLPDLLDKPLTYLFAVLPSGRSLGHSLLLAVFLVGLLWVLAEDSQHRRLVGAFGVGYGSHLVADGLYPALAGQISDLRYLAYPLVQPVQYDVEQGFFAYLQTHLLTLDPSPVVLFELGLTVTALVMWYADGLPGLDLLLPNGVWPGTDEHERGE